MFELLADEQRLIGSENIILGGASLGGALAIHAGCDIYSNTVFLFLALCLLFTNLALESRLSPRRSLRHKQKLGGIVSVSGYVNQRAIPRTRAFV